MVHTFYRTVAAYLFRPSMLGVLLLSFVIAAAVVAIRRRRAAMRAQGRRFWGQQPL